MFLYISIQRNVRTKIMFDWCVKCDEREDHTSAAPLSWPASAKLVIWILVLERSGEFHNSLFKLFVMILLVRKELLFWEVYCYRKRFRNIVKLFRSVRLLIPELAVLAAVDDEVHGAVEDNKKVGDGHRDLKLIINQ